MTGGVGAETGRLAHAASLCSTGRDVLPSVWIPDEAAVGICVAIGIAVVGPPTPAPTTAPIIIVPAAAAPAAAAPAAAPAAALPSASAPAATEASATETAGKTATASESSATEASAMPAASASAMPAAAAAVETAASAAMPAAASAVAIGQSRRTRRQDTSGAADRANGEIDRWSHGNLPWPPLAPRPQEPVQTSAQLWVRAS
jgi:hypothetical protein